MNPISLRGGGGGENVPMLISNVFNFLSIQAKDTNLTNFYHTLAGSNLL